VNSKPVIPRGDAVRDIEDAIDHYAIAANQRISRGFADALERAFRYISTHPGAGSPRYSHELGIFGLRSWPLRRYPYLVFYVERDSHIDVLRVLHGQRDIPDWMHDG
jgi:toxin ParE1/3/4